MTCEDAEILLHALIDGELDASHVREVEAHLASCAKCAALARDYREMKRAFAGGGLRHEQVDDVLAPAIDHRTDGAGVDVIEPATGQGKTLRGEIDHRRRDVEPAVEPRFYRVLVGGNHVGEVAGLQRAQMRGDELGLDAHRVIAAQHDGEKTGGRDRRDRGAKGKSFQHRAPRRHFRLRQ